MPTIELIKVCSNQGIKESSCLKSHIKVPNWVDPESDCFTIALLLGCDQLIDTAGNMPAGV